MVRKTVLLTLYTSIPFDNYEQPLNKLWAESFHSMPDVKTKKLMHNLFKVYFVSWTLQRDNYQILTKVMSHLKSQCNIIIK